MSFYDFNYTPFTKPSKDRFYIKILARLAEGGRQTIDQIYSAIPGTEKRKYDFEYKWVNWGLLTALVKERFVKRTGRIYEITESGKAFYDKVMA